MIQKKRIRIAFGHKARSGKDTAAEYIKRVIPHATIIHFSDPVYGICANIQAIAGKPAKKDRKLLQFIGEGLKDVYDDRAIWVRVAELRIRQILASNENASIVIADLRFPEEAEMLRGYGFTLVNIIRNIDRDSPEFHSYPEVALDKYKFDREIYNVFSVAELQKKIDAILSDLSGA